MVDSWEERGEGTKETHLSGECLHTILYKEKDVTKLEAESSWRNHSCGFLCVSFFKELLRHNLALVGPR